MEKDRLFYLVSICEKEIKDIGIEIENQITYKIGNAKSRYGRCTNKNIIEISKWVFELNEKDIKNTIVHELLHTIKGTNGHCRKWKYYAMLMNNKYNYDISRVGNSNNDFKKVNKSEQDKVEIMGYRYKKTCNTCGNIHYWHRATQRKIQAYKQGNCSCVKCKNKSFKIQDLKMNIDIY